MCKKSSCQMCPGCKRKDEKIEENNKDDESRD